MRAERAPAVERAATQADLMLRPSSAGSSARAARERDRREFAVAAMQGLLSGGSMLHVSNQREAREGCARLAVMLADALLAELSAAPRIVRPTGKGAPR